LWDVRFIAQIITQSTGEPFFVPVIINSQDITYTI
jgi:hypothetical protein